MTRHLYFCLFLGFASALCSAQTFTDTVFHTFTTPSQCPAIIVTPSCTGLMQASDGNYYGTTVIGGSLGDGSVYRVTPSGKYSTVYSFANEADGSEPDTSLIEGPDGNLYGIAGLGGAGDSGVIFKLTFSGKFTTMYSFCYPTACQGGTGAPDLRAPLILGSDGDFYGDAGGGGDVSDCYVIPYSIGCGFIFKMTPGGVFTDLHDLLPTEGDAEASALLEASDGNFYGVTPIGGDLNLGYEGQGLGTVFKVTPGGDFTVLHQFSDSGDSAEPHGALVEANDSNLYGTTNGDSGFGSVFRVNSTGTLTTVFNFLFKNYKTTGLTPDVGLFPGSDGALYGTTEGGGNPKYCPGNDDCGTIYRMTTSGDQTILYQFCSRAGCADGYGTSGPLIQGSDGALYGDTTYGGNLSDCQNEGCGTVYKLSSNPGIKGPVQLTLSASTTQAGSPVNLTWSVSNAFSLTMQQCYAFVQGSPAGAGMWTGKQAGTYSSATNLLTGASTINPTAVGTYTYALTCGGTESGFATLNVTKDTKANSTTALTASSESPSVGQQVNLSATVSGSGAMPTGSVTFSVGGVSLGTASLNGSSVATLTASTNGIAPSPYPVTATYSGNSSYNPSASKALIISLAKAPTLTTLAASPTSVAPPASVTLTATIARSAPGAGGTPSGSVTFYANGSVALANINLNSDGVASLTAPSSGYAAGPYAITAAYSGDSSDTDSASDPVTVSVK